MSSVSKQKNSLMGLVALSCVGWGNALWTLAHQQKLLARGLEENSFCNVGSAFNCDAVALSNYSSFAGISVSAWGMLFYAVFFLFSVWAYFLAVDKKAEKLGSAINLLLGFSALALLPTVALAVTSFFVIKTGCLMCIFGYLINLALAVLAYSLWKSSAPKIAFGRSPSFVPTSLWMVVAIFGILQLFSPKIVASSVNEGPQMDDSLTQSYLSRYLQEPEKKIVTEGMPFMGPKDAPVTIVEFSDFQCPFCKRAAKTIPTVTASYGDKVRIVFKHYPLNSACNPTPGMHSGGHPFACRAAKTSHCVFKMKGNTAFFRYVDAVFEKQSSLSDEVIRQAAAGEGLTGEELEKCVNDMGTHQAIMDQAAEGNALGVQGTPAVYVNNRFAEGGALPRLLKPILDHLLGGR